MSEDEPLAFDKAEFAPDAEPDATPMCGVCKRPLGREYFTVNENETCEDCHHLLSHQLKEAKGGMAFIRALGIGAVAAVGGSIAWYAVAKITGMEIGLLAIAVGYIVGRAVRHGSRGPGGRRYQALAMLLTYVSITGSYLPTVIKSLEDTHQDAAKSTSATPPPATAATESTSAATPGALPADAPAEPPRALQGIVWLVFVVGITLVAPFLAGFSNIIGLLLIAIALYEAWKLNKPLPIVISGPLRRKKQKPPAPPPEVAADAPSGG